MLPTVCGVRDEAGECTFAGIEAESSANCIMPLNSVIDRLKALKVGDRVGESEMGGWGEVLWQHGHGVNKAWPRVPEWLVFLGSIPVPDPTPWVQRIDAGQDRAGFRV